MAGLMTSYMTQGAVMLLLPPPAPTHAPAFPRSHMHALFLLRSRPCTPPPCTPACYCDASCDEHLHLIPHAPQL